MIEKIYEIWIKMKIPFYFIFIYIQRLREITQDFNNF